MLKLLPARQHGLGLSSGFFSHESGAVRFISDEVLLMRCGNFCACVLRGSIRQTQVGAAAADSPS